MFIFEEYMHKGRILFLIVLVFIQVPFAKSQELSNVHQGFHNYKEAADSIWAAILNKKVTTLNKFTVDLNDFTKETRKRDTVVKSQMILGYYRVYYFTVDKSFRRIKKQFKKEQLTAKKATIDTVLLYRNTGDTNIHKAELYFKRNKKRGYIRYYLWNVNGLWYLSGKLEYIEDPTPVK